MAIYLRCRACGQEHEFPVVVSRQTFETLTHQFRSEWTRNWVRCPQLGNASSISSGDLYWKD